MKKIYLIKMDRDISINIEMANRLKSSFYIVGEPGQADILIVLGGDGTMLKAIHKYRHLKLPFFGINYGHKGFLMNDPKTTRIIDLDLKRYETVSARMLRADLYDKHDEKIGIEFAFNDFYFERAMPPTARIRVLANGEILSNFDPLVCDGVIVCTAAGSTAYNASAGGIIIPLTSHEIVLTGISPAVFHRWYKRSTIFQAGAYILLEAMNTDKRPVRFLADGAVIENVAKAKINYSNQRVNLLFATSQNFQQKRLELLF